MARNARSPLRRLLAIDLVREAAPACAEVQGRVDRCRRLLAYARAAGWAVSHVYPRGGRPAAGVEPLLSESIYYRAGQSPFANRALKRSVRVGAERELVIMALSLSSAVLSAALSAHDLGVAVTLVGDTLQSGDEGAASLEAIETITHALEAPFVHVEAIDQLIDSRRGLHLVGRDDETRVDTAPVVAKPHDAA